MIRVANEYVGVEGTIVEAKLHKQGIEAIKPRSMTGRLRP